nr:hypothetical protein [Desulfurococcales archaeon]
MRDTPLLQRLLVVASVLAILAAAFTWLPQAVVSIASSGELEIDIDTDSLGLSDYVVEWALLTVPRHGAYHAEVGEKGGLLSLKFRLGELLQGAESGGAERPLAAPVVTVKLTDFNGGKTVGLVIPSSFILSLKLNGGKPLTAAELQSMLSKDPLKALRVGKVVVGPRELAMLKSLGLVRESPIERGPLPEGASARMLGNLELPPKGGLCGGRVYHLVNYSSAVWREPTPSWWRERFTHTGGDGDADSYWKRFKSYLGAGYYLASTDYSLNDAISCIARHVNPSSEREGGETSLYSMDAFIGGNRWNDTYPAGSIIYAGPIPLFSYEIQNEAGASGSRAFVVHVTLD